MKTYAFIKNNAVHLVDQIEESDYSNHIRGWDTIIDIEDINPRPQIGWQLIGNVLLPVSPDLQQSEQRIFGSTLCIEMIDKMGARNLSIAQSGSAVNVAGVLSSLSVVKGLLETGALKTARTAIMAYGPSFPLHSDIMNEAVEKITHFLQSKGWDG